MTDQLDSAVEDCHSEDHTRRQFIGRAGRFAAVTPPAITLLLGTSLGSKAIAGSAGIPHKPCPPKLKFKHKPKQKVEHKPKHKVEHKPEQKVEHKPELKFEHKHG